MFYQQLKRVQYKAVNSRALDFEVDDTRTMHMFQSVNLSSRFVDFCVGALASSAAVAVMNPLDTVKTRLVTQVHDTSALAMQMHGGIAECAWSILRDEGFLSFYKSLPPRLLSVVPMMSVQVCFVCMFQESTDFSGGRCSSIVWRRLNGILLPRIKDGV
jgi:hypothetical protein